MAEGQLHGLFACRIMALHDCVWVWRWCMAWPAALRADGDQWSVHHVNQTLPTCHTAPMASSRASWSRAAWWETRGHACDKRLLKASAAAASGEHQLRMIQDMDVGAIRRDDTLCALQKQRPTIQ
jgi:glycine/D-amino acid oxidase-like deaminating enzyme